MLGVKHRIHQCACGVGACGAPFRTDLQAPFRDEAGELGRSVPGVAIDAHASGSQGFSDDDKAIAARFAQRRTHRLALCADHGGEMAVFAEAHHCVPGEVYWLKGGDARGAANGQEYRAGEEDSHSP